MAQNLRADDRLEKSMAPVDATLNDEQSMARLLGEIVGDAQKLVRQELALARVELQQEWSKAKIAASGYVLAVSVGFAFVFLLGMCVAQGLMAAGLAPWLAYALVTLAYGGTAYALIRKSYHELSQIDLVPRKAMETMKENVQWIRNPT